MSKDGVRTNVARLRRRLAAAYRDLFGHPPDDPLLVQTRQGQGYRLDPTLRLRDPAEL